MARLIAARLNNRAYSRRHLRLVRWRRTNTKTEQTTMHPQLKRALEYISNTGGSPNITQFDEDHEPIGPMLREQLKDAQLVYEREGRIHECPSNVERIRAEIQP